MDYVYVVVKLFESDHIGVEVYDSEEIAKGRANFLQARYYKRPIHYNLKDGFATLDKGEH